jgi:hypothetical protein
MKTSTDILTAARAEALFTRNVSAHTQPSRAALGILQRWTVIGRVVRIDDGHAPIVPRPGRPGHQPPPCGKATQR